MIVILTLILFTTGLMIASAITDFRAMKIPNLFPSLIAIGFVIAWVLKTALGLDVFQSATSHFLSGAIVFIIMIILFFAKIFGGGDAKIIPAIALWTGVQGLPAFLMVTSVVGGLLAVISIVMRRTNVGQKLLTKLIQKPYLQNGWVSEMVKGKSTVPYGIAIAIGGIVAFRTIGYLP